MIICNEFSKNIVKSLINSLRHDGEVEYELLEYRETDDVLLYVLYNTATYKYFCLGYSVKNNYISDSLILNYIVLGVDDFYLGDYINFMADCIENNFYVDITDYGYYYTENIENEMLSPYIIAERHKMADSFRQYENVKVDKILSYRIYLI